MGTVTFDYIDLDAEQRQLFLEMVEAYRSAPRGRREFVFSAGHGWTHLQQVGTDAVWNGIQRHDLDVLARFQLLDVRYSSRRGDPIFNVSPVGNRYYEQLRERRGEQVEQMQEAVIGYLDGHDFANRFPQAHLKWSEAAQMLWSPDSEKQLSTIGHLLREAMQAFADVLVRDIADACKDSAKTVARLRAAIKAAAGLATTERPFLDALIVYWGTVADLVQRQEHAGQKEGESITWEDARRAVFQSAMVMYEVARALRS